MTCPICGGQRVRLVKSIHPYTKMTVSRTEPCACFLSDLVTNDCTMLESIRDTWLDPDKRFLLFNPSNLPASPNYILRGDYRTLALEVKSLMMLCRFMEPKPRIFFGQSIDVLHKFYVEQKDGTSTNLSETNKFSLMAICLGTEEANKALKTVIAQVLYTRQRDRKPTWLYLPSNRQSLSQCLQEYSPELDTYTESFKVITLAPTGMGEAASSLPGRDDAASFGGLQ